MRSLFLAVFLFSFPAVSLAEVYRCRATVGGDSYLTHMVDTSIGAEYLWYFPKQPAAQPTCGRGTDAGRLRCRLDYEAEGKAITHSWGEIEAGDKILVVEAPSYLGGVGGNISCALAEDEL